MPFIPYNASNNQTNCILQIQDGKMQVGNFIRNANLLLIVDKDSNGQPILDNTHLYLTKSWLHLWQGRVLIIGPFPLHCGCETHGVGACYCSDQVLLGSRNPLQSLAMLGNLCLCLCFTSMVQLFLEVFLSPFDCKAIAWIKNFSKNTNPDFFFWK